MIYFIYLGLSLVVPLLVIPITGEAFEFNKIVVVYLATTIGVGYWLYKALKVRQINFRRTIMDWAIVLFLVSQFVSTLTSTDQHTSLLGYYHRFNGGLVSSICYALLYWTFVSNYKPGWLSKVVKGTAIATVIVLGYAIVQRLGVDPISWDQDSTLRVFSTLGQPNLLAAWLAVVSTLFWVRLSQTSKPRNISGTFILIVVTYAVILFTASRAAIGAYILSYSVFWLVALRKRVVLVTTVLMLTFTLAAITIWISTSPIPTKRNYPAAVTTNAYSIHSASGSIRLMLLQGSWTALKERPLFGWGPNTFAFVYPLFRPQTHNLTPEWNYTYDKTHNEVADILVGSGIVGLSTYLILHIAALIMLTKSTLTKTASNISHQLGYICAVIILIITNLVGFPSVTLSILVVIIGASVAAKSGQTISIKLPTLSKSLIYPLWALVAFLIAIIASYWSADILFERGLGLAQQRKYFASVSSFRLALNQNPYEPAYWDSYASSLTNTGNINQALAAAKHAVNLSPNSARYTANLAALYMRLMVLDSATASDALATLTAAQSLAPTDPTIPYNIALVYIALKDTNSAKTALAQSLALKPDYAEAIALGKLYPDLL